MNIGSSSGGEMGLFWGQSYESYDAAIQAAAEAARQSLGDKTLGWLEVAELRGRFSDGKLQYQVSVRIGYT